jgi:16S rRNA (guanine527-N7)-methyltransferase
MLEPLEAYYRLLEQWNATINLTALPLDAPTDATFDRLLVEPLAAAREIDHITAAFRRGFSPVWFDLGSGGGSPAIPLKIARPALQLTMIESKERKSAFLREAARALGLAGASVVTERFEQLVSNHDFRSVADFATVRAVRADDELFSSTVELLKPGGHLLVFRPGHAAAADPAGFTLVRTAQLCDSPPTFLSVFRRVFHVEQSR